MPISSFSAPSAIAKPGVCTSSTRPASPYEGQVIYTTDTDLLQIWNGTAWRTLAFATPTNGSILQIANATYSTQVSSTSATYADSGLSVSITPTSTSSKCLILVNQSGFANTAGTSLNARLLRDSTTLQTQVDMVYAASSNVLSAVVFAYLDSPATTSSVTYKTQYARGAGSGTVYMQMNSNPSNITVMEIAA